MGWKDLFKKKKSTGLSLTDLTLSNLGPGYYLDYDMKTWCVEACHMYDWGEGDRTYEWQLVSHDDTLYLEREPDDEDHWSVSRKVPFGKLGEDLKSQIMERGDPPNEIIYEGTAYYLEGSGGGQFYKDGKGDGRDLLTWDYVDESGKQYLTIEQWGEADFEAALGYPVAEYQFDNILPAGEADD